MQNLKGKIALVTGASRGGGRGIAAELGLAGATVYVTGRSGRDGAITSETKAARPLTVDETAHIVTEAGGIGIPVYCDHANDEEVEMLYHRIEEEQGKLDILVNNAGEDMKDTTTRGSTVRFGSSPCGAWIKCIRQDCGPTRFRVVWGQN